MMDVFYFLALLAGFAAGVAAGAWFVCLRVRGGSEPTMVAVFSGGGGGPAPDK
jgi:hypothetical protein